MVKARFNRRFSFTLSLIKWSAWIDLLIFPNLAWSTCGFDSFPSVYATVNKTVMVKCRSNCTPIRILHVVDGSETDEVDPQSEDSVVNESYPYVTIAAIHLDLTYNDTGLICKAVSVPSQPSTDVAWIQIQDFLQPVKNLRPTFNATHIQFKWEPPPVLEGIKLRYKIHLFREGVVIVNDTVNRTNYVVGFNCPCQPSCFAVTPIAGLLEGEEQAISPGPSCTEDDPEISLNKNEFVKNMVADIVRIAFEIQTFNSWCLPSAAVMSAHCQHTHVHKIHTFDQFVCDDSIIKLLSPSNASLPAHDFCTVSLTLKFSDNYTAPPQDPFNISLFDTQLATMKLMESSPALCVTCQIAVWAKDALECIVYIRIPRDQNPTFYENETTSEGQLACFRKLPTDTRLSVYIAVFDEDRRYMHRVAVRNETWINFTSNQRPTGNKIPTNHDDNHTTIGSFVGVVIICLAAVALIGGSIYLCYRYFWKKPKSDSRKISSTPPVPITEKDSFYEDPHQEGNTNDTSSRSLVPSPSPLPASQTRDRSSQHTLQADRQFSKEPSCTSYHSARSECSIDEHDMAQLRSAAQISNGSEDSAQNGATGQ